MAKWEGFRYELNTRPERMLNMIFGPLIVVMGIGLIIMFVLLLKQI